MSTTPSPNDPAAPGNEVRTYRGRTLEELIPRIRAELGAGAIILRERQGLTGGIGGFFAQRCVEIDAQAPQRVSVYAGDLEDLEEIDEELEVDEQTFAAASTPETPAAPAAPNPFAATLQAAGVEPLTPFPALAVPASVPVVSSEPLVSPEPVVAAAPVTEPTPVPQAEAEAGPGYIAFDELSTPAPAASPAAPAPAPAADLPTLAIPVRLERAMGDAVTAAAPSSGVFRALPTGAPAVWAPVAPVAAPEPTPAPPAPPAPDRAAEQALIHHLTDQGFSADFATALVADAARLAGPGVDPTHALQASLAAALPGTPSLPLAGGAVAIVGSGGSGKTRTVAAMAIACARAGHTVTVASLGAPERSSELAELLRDETVQVIPAMRTRATAAAVASARRRGLVIVDTTSVSTGDRSAAEVLAETLTPFELDCVLLTVPATFTARAADRAVQSFAAVHPHGMIATHLDEADGLGAIAEVAISRRLGLGHTHTGLELATAIAAVDPGQLAGALLR